ncbi:TrkA C-terminal domain-containing protein [Methanolobus halotolerans]|nr:TrkA C-terminal domain-containing protein [Methanolobus halotolerans]
MRKLIKLLLSRFTSIKVYDYQQLLGLTKGYSVGKVKVREDRWLPNRTIGSLKLNEEGVLVLGIFRELESKEIFIGSPDEETEILPKDILICYGPNEIISDLSERTKGLLGYEKHKMAVENAKAKKGKEKLEEKE